MNACATCKHCRRLDDSGYNVDTGGRLVCIRTIEPEECPVFGCHKWTWLMTHTCAFQRSDGCGADGTYYEPVSARGQSHVPEE
jgi:hypothetical protein